MTGLPSLRDERLFAVIRPAFAAASRNGLGLLHFSVQPGHLHLLVEADEPTRLTRGVQGLAIRVAKTINRVLRRHGAVWGDRVHSRILTTPRQVRNALVYVLNNWRKHLARTEGCDSRSSAAWFDGWHAVVPLRVGWKPVASARTWLARVGWRRHGLLAMCESPRIRRPRR